MGVAEVSTASDALDMEPVLRIIEEMSPVTSGDIIPLLQRIQRAYGYLPKDVVVEAAKITGISASRIYGIATFYEQFHFEPHGKHTVRCCRGTACHVRGARDMLDAIERTLGIRAGETTEDMLFSLETVACLVVCALAPVLVVDDTYHGKMTPRRTEKLLKDVIAREK